MTDARPRTAAANEPTWDDVARMLEAADVNPRTRDTSAASAASAKARRRPAAERRFKEFAPFIGDLSEATLIALTRIALANLDARGLEVPEV